MQKITIIRELFNKITDKYGPFYVSGKEVSTGIFANSNDIIITESFGTINFRHRSGPERDADGEDSRTPDHYPAPHLKKHSLICKVGFKWYQGGKLRFFIPLKDGKIYLRANDDRTSDNTGKFDVFIYHIKKPDKDLLNNLKDELEELSNKDLREKRGLSTKQQNDIGSEIMSFLLDMIK
jgi:hypothetical protein